MKKNNYQGALQQPIDSGFNAASTTSDVIKGVDLTIASKKNLDVKRSIDRYKI